MDEGKANRLWPKRGKGASSSLILGGTREEKLMVSQDQRELGQGKDVGSPCRQLGAADRINLQEEMVLDNIELLAIRMVERSST
jgi:hypothetical protein